MRPDGWHEVIDPRRTTEIYYVSAKIENGELVSLLDCDYDFGDGKPVELLGGKFLTTRQMNFIIGQLQ
jgi:hypothetical protein